jgi:hypothetical protein
MCLHALQAEVFELQARCNALQNQNSVLQTAAVNAGRSLPATAFLPVELPHVPHVTLTQSLPVSLAVSPVSSMPSNPLPKPATGASFDQPSLVLSTVDVDVPLDPSLMVRVETPANASVSPRSPQVSGMSPKSGTSEFTPWRAPSGTSSLFVKEMIDGQSGVAETHAVSAATSVFTQEAPPRLTESAVEGTESGSGEIGVGTWMAVDVDRFRVSSQTIRLWEAKSAWLARHDCDSW